MLNDIHSNVETRCDVMKQRKQYTIRFPPGASIALEEMAKEEDVSAAELIRRAVNFYQLKIDAKKGDKRIVLEGLNSGGSLSSRELVMI